MRRDGHNGLHDRLLGMPTNQRRTRYARLPWRHFERLHRFARHVLTVDGPRTARCQVAMNAWGPWFDTDHVVPLRWSTWSNMEVTP